ncbi:hypothetical protein NC651_007833 [Populus alba x Populus x berolinensis]|nr:hypothetical protein NC651_007833 [Populus alba x Populus x berolinensis]
MRFLGHSLLVSFSPLLSILYRGGVSCMLLVWQKSSERSTLFGKMSLKTISIGCPNGEEHLEQLLYQTSTASLSSKTPSFIQPH